MWRVNGLLGRSECLGFSTIWKLGLVPQKPNKNSHDRTKHDMKIPKLLRKSRRDRGIKLPTKSPSPILLIYQVKVYHGNLSVKVFCVGTSWCEAESIILAK